MISTAEHYVGNVQRDNGVRVAQWFLDNVPDGGKVAVIEGRSSLPASGRAASPTRSRRAASSRWSPAYRATGTARPPMMRRPTSCSRPRSRRHLRQQRRHGARRGRGGEGRRTLDEQVRLRTDGISDAYASIRAGELDGTVDSFPVLTGEVAMEVALGSWAVRTFRGSSPRRRRWSRRKTSRPIP